MSITVITPTRGRPHQFSLLEQWVARQTVQPDQWLVVNDSDQPDGYRYNLGQQVIKRRRKEGELHSLCENWLAALRFGRIKGDKVLVMEDDDYYSPLYIERLASLLDEAPLAGFNLDCYWIVGYQMFRNMENVSHCSLAATGFTREVIPFLRQIAKRGNPFIDAHLWDEWTGGKVMRPDREAGRPYHVGIKGMGGEPGISTHSHLGLIGSRDWGCSILRDWVGTDDKVYNGYSLDAAAPPVTIVRVV